MLQTLPNTHNALGGVMNCRLGKGNLPIELDSN